MKEVACFCMSFSSLWEQMVKAYKYITGIFSVTHTSEQQASDRDKQPTKMDVSLLEEQYDHIKQKQKLQSHVIVFKTGAQESVLPESMVSAVLINKKVRKSKSFTEHVPIRKVRLEVTSNGNVQDNSPWRTHLGIHRLAQAPCQEVPWDPSGCRNGPCSFDNQRLISKENGPLQHQELEGASELSVLSQLGSSSMSNGFSKENGSNVSEGCQKPPLKSAASAVWMQQYISSTKCTPACHKLDFYPFPNKKAPRISEAARRLGLYVSR
uniref:Chromosome 9 open reading frame 152 n=1 Tax=Anser brachyrhynchus TaxID=132585 RepID=A0A8B9CS99_9AVES